MRCRWLRRFLCSPKGYLLVSLIVLAALGTPSTGIVPALTGVGAASLSAVAAELALLRLSGKSRRMPSSALLTGVIVALVLSAQEPSYVPAVAAALAITGKHLLRTGRAHIFNSAALGLVLTFVLLGSGQSWWGALANLPPAAVLLVAALGMTVAQRANKLPAALSFVGVYVSLFTLAALSGMAGAVEGIFRAPLINVAVFFGFLMVTDPPTSPVPFGAQACFGAGVALLGFGIYLSTRNLCFLPAALLAANLGLAVYAARCRQRQTIQAAGGTAIARGPGRGMPRAHGTETSGSKIPVRT